MEADGRLTPTQAKSVLAELLASGGDPEAIARAKGYEALSADALSGFVDQVITENPAEWEKMRAGDPKIVGFLIGRVMKLARGNADGAAVTEELRRRAAQT
jgi:Asp-tRNA(Asn)/Glu-tRNA(Gln) amidotransferase B subunit